MAGIQRASIHLRRDYDLLCQVDAKTDASQRQGAAHSAQPGQDGLLMAGMAAFFAIGRALSDEKGKLLADISLASGEIERTAPPDPSVAIDTPEGLLSPTSLRCSVLLVRGRIELIYGTGPAMKRPFAQSLQVVETLDAHYMLGLILAHKYKPADALAHFEQYLAMQPDDEYSVSALRKANAMRNHKRGFRGHCFLLIISRCPYIAPGVLYWRVQYKLTKGGVHCGQRLRGYRLVEATDRRGRQSRYGLFRKWLVEDRNWPH